MKTETSGTKLLNYRMNLAFLSFLYKSLANPTDRMEKVQKALFTLDSKDINDGN